MSETIEKLKELREQFQLTKIEIADGCNVREMTVHRWLTNNNAPHPQHISAIEKFVSSARKRFAIEEKKEIEKCIPLIVPLIYNGDYEFFPIPKMKETATLCPQGRLRRVIKLSECAETTGKLLTNSIVIKSIEAIARRGLIQIFDLKLDRRLSYNDVSFFLDLGTAKREMPSNVITPERLFKDEPIPNDAVKEAESGEALLLDVEKVIKALRMQKRKSCEAQFGTVSDMEQKLHAEDLQDESEQRNTGQEIINALKGAKKMKGDHIPPSEYDEVTFRKKKREFYEEAVENNTDRPLIVYNCNNEKIEIPPHEKRIVLKIRMIKPMAKAEDKVIK